MITVLDRFSSIAAHICLLSLDLCISGSMGPPKREKAWHEKRVFFLTPQVLTNDLSRGSCPAEDVKCLVIDEAHKALGNHAYCQVLKLYKPAHVILVLIILITY